jgi:energy-coupling factor transport system substrate-specific component
MRSAFNTLTLALMPIAIVLNIAIGYLVTTLKLPLYLDSIGTVLVGALAGPLAGGLTGFLSNIVWSLMLSDPVILWFAPVALIIGVLAGVVGARSWLRRLPTTLLAGLLTGLVAALVSAPIAAYVFGGVTGGGTDLLVAAFQNFTQSIITANLLQGVVSDPLDKVISFLVVFLILKGLPRRLLVRFPQGDKSAPPHRKPLIGHID